MSTALTKKVLIEMLSAAAAQRFGEERAKVLIPAIQDISASLASLAQHQIELLEEPAFFLENVPLKKKPSG